VDENKLIGQLRHRITFQTMAAVSDGQGGNDITWTNVIEVWASVQPKSGGETFFAERVEARTTDVIIVRDLGNLINEDMRIVFGSRVLMIKSIDRFQNSKTFFQKIDTTDKVGS
jgi:SPP1 family predicted phage head-tail adaptor